MSLYDDLICHSIDRKWCGDGSAEMCAKRTSFKCRVPSQHISGKCHQLTLSFPITRTKSVGGVTIFFCPFYFKLGSYAVRVNIHFKWLERRITNGIDKCKETVNIWESEAIIIYACACVSLYVFTCFKLCYYRISNSVINLIEW